MIYPLVTIAVGALALWPWLARVVPALRAHEEFARQARPTVGLIALGVGLLLIFRLLFAFGSSGGALWLGVSVVDLLLGFTFAFTRLDAWLFRRKPDLRSRSERLWNRLRPLEPLLGVLAIVVGVLVMIRWL